MDTQKYYTPEIEEFYVGFEFQMLTDVFNNQESIVWVNCKVNEAVILSGIAKAIEEETIRAKYLDRKDIEELGWKFTTKSIDDWYEIQGDFEMSSWTCRKMVMHYGKEDKRMYINAYDTDVKGSNVFEGTIKNKSELKVLMNQLKITK